MAARERTYGEPDLCLLDGRFVPDSQCTRFEDKKCDAEHKGNTASTVEQVTLNDTRFVNWFN